MIKISVDHLSSKWDRSAVMAVKAVHRSLLTPSVVAVGLTEVSGKVRNNLLRDVYRKDNYVLSGEPGTARAENMLIMRRSEWDDVHYTVRTVGTFLGYGHPTTVVAARGLHVKSGKIGLISVFHLPSSVEGNWAQRGRRVAVHQQSVRKIRKLHRRWRKQYKIDFEIAGGDWNLDLHKGWVRKWVKGAWPALTPVPANEVSQRGSHGNRLIDWFVTRGVRRRSLWVLDQHPHSDHKGVRLNGVI